MTYKIIGAALAPAASVLHNAHSFMATLFSMQSCMHTVGFMLPYFWIYSFAKANQPDMNKFFVYSDS